MNEDKLNLIEQAKAEFRKNPAKSLSKLLFEQTESDLACITDSLINKKVVHSHYERGFATHFLNGVQISDVKAKQLKYKIKRLELIHKLSEDSSVTDIQRSFLHQLFSTTLKDGDISAGVNNVYATFKRVASLISD